MSEANAEQYDWIDAALEEMKDPIKEIVLHPRQPKKTEEKDEFNELDEMFLAFKNKMITIKDRLKDEKEEMNKLITSCEFENAQLKLDNKELDESNSKLEEKNKELEDENKRLRAEINAINEAVKKLNNVIFVLYSQKLQMEEDVAKMLQDPQKTEDDNNN